MQGAEASISLQLRWFEPGETGGRPIQEYTAQMRPPSTDAASQHPNSEVGGFEMWKACDIVATGHLRLLLSP